MAIFGWVILLLFLGAWTIATGIALFGASLFGGDPDEFWAIWLLWVAFVIWLLTKTAPFALVPV